MSKLNVLNAWAGNNKYSARRSAQSFMSGHQMAFAASDGGSSCGTNDPKPQPSSCGTSEDPKPSSCGTGGK